MKVSRILCLCLCAVAALPQFAAAQAAADTQGLAVVRSILNFCAKVDPKGAAFFRAQEKSLVQGVSAKQLERVQESSNYKQEYSSISEVLEALPRSGAEQTCAASAPPILANRKKDE